MRSLESTKAACGGYQPKAAVTDRGFSSPDSRVYLADRGIREETFPRSPPETRRRVPEAQSREHQLRRRQTEGRLGVLKNLFLGKPVRGEGYEFRSSSVAWAVLAHNL